MSSKNAAASRSLAHARLPVRQTLSRRQGLKSLRSGIFPKGKLARNSSLGQMSTRLSRAGDRRLAPRQPFIEPTRRQPIKKMRIQDEPTSCMVLQREVIIDDPAIPIRAQRAARDIFLALHEEGIAPLALSAGTRLCSVSITFWVLKP